VPRAICRDPDVLIVKVEGRNYGLLKFLVDVGMTILTSGFWLIWVFVREMRR
jgi:hypothetical protein